MGLPDTTFYRFLYGETGRAYQWTDRMDWDEATIQEHLSRPEVQVFWMQAEGSVAGWCELERQEDEVQVAYFGLLPAFVGKGWGKFWLDWVVRKAWQPAPKRVWVHTCDLDHEAALPLYKKMGFEAYKQMEVTPS